MFVCLFVCLFVFSRYSVYCVILHINYCFLIPAFTFVIKLFVTFLLSQRHVLKKCTETDTLQDVLQIEVGRPTMFDMKFKIYIIARFAGPTIHKLFEHILQSFEKKTLCIK